MLTLNTTNSQIFKNSDVTFFFYVGRCFHTFPELKWIVQYIFHGPSMTLHTQHTWKRQLCSQNINSSAAVKPKESLNTRNPPAAHSLQPKHCNVVPSFMHIITSTVVISNNSYLSNKPSQTPSLACWLNLQCCCISSVQSDLSSWAPLPLTPSLRLSPSFKSSLLAWARIAHEFRNDITHLFDPLFTSFHCLEKVKLQHSPPSTAFTSHLCVCAHLQISYHSADWNVVNRHKYKNISAVFYWKHR